MQRRIFQNLLFQGFFKEYYSKTGTFLPLFCRNFTKNVVLLQSNASFDCKK